MPRIDINLNTPASEKEADAYGITEPAPLNDGEEWNPVPGKPGWFARKRDGFLKLVRKTMAAPSRWDILP